jgi:hypothetical protein
MPPVLLEVPDGSHAAPKLHRIPKAIFQNSSNNLAVSATERRMEM